MKKIPTLVMIVALVVVIILALQHAGKQPKLAPQDAKVIPITITSTTIVDDTFSGSRPVISGSDPIVTLAHEFVDTSISAFRSQADAEVPAMREQFGNDAPPAHFTIDIGATLVTGGKTQSLVIDTYAYRGGANGSSSYNVFTSDSTTGQILTLGDIIVEDKQDAFVGFVKKSLLDWRPEGMTQSVVFKEDVEKLAFASFDNVALDENNLILYFDKNEIGPGALGAVAFPIKISDVEAFTVRYTQGYSSQ